MCYVPRIIGNQFKTFDNKWNGSSLSTKCSLSTKGERDLKMISLLLTMTRHGSKVCMLEYTPLLFQLKRFSTVQLGYKVKLTRRDLASCMQVSCV